MKRREGPVRKQVLDIDSASTWTNKYQNIADRSLNGVGVSNTLSNPLSRLVGGYASDSDGEEESKAKSSLDAKVEEFMKEVESTKTNDDSSIIPCAWQEIYDESTGYPYYWNMNTNEVTWEPPPELVAYQAAEAAKLAQTQAKEKAQAQQAQWAVEQAALGLTPEYPVAQKKVPPAAPSLKSVPKNKQLPAAPHSGSGKQSKRGPKKRPASESDDEKIEMITSWVDEESEEEDELKNIVGQSSNDKKSCKDTKTVSSISSSSRKPPKPAKPAPPPVIFGPQLPAALPDYKSSSKSKNRSRNGSIEEEVESKVVIQKLRRLKTESDVIVGTRERVPIRKSLDRSRSGSPNPNSSKCRLGESASASVSERDSEKSILNRLHKQVQQLKDLGGNIPNDIKDLLKTASTSSLSNVTADSIIAMIEMEQPPDHKQDGRLMSSLQAAEERIQKALQKINSDSLTNGSDKAGGQGSKPTSFALIAGYGDDSDQEETVESDTSANGKEKFPVKERTLFPILSVEENAKEEESQKARGKAVVSDLVSAVKVSASEVSSKSSLLVDHSLGHKRKKRLDIGMVHPQPKPSCNTVELSDETSRLKGINESTTSYTTVWSSSSSYASDPTANDRRGFGFQAAEEEASQSSKPKKGKIQFIKAETLNIQSEESGNVRDRDKEADNRGTTLKSREDGELHGGLSSLAELVKAKLQFLSEGKEPVSPVQAMAIQIETLVSAWNAGALTDSFLQRWLQSTGAELVQLERAAAPQGWAVQWDREYKRYFYCNLATKDTQWDYPVLPGDELKTERSEETSNPVMRVTTPPPDDEDAMELCTTPPPEEETDCLIESHPPSPPLNPPPAKKPKTDENSGENNVHEAEMPLPSSCPGNQPPLPVAPQPPLPSSPPPPPPPPDAPPPPPPPGTPPPTTPPSSSSRSRMAEHGEPLPPGVDSPDIPFVPVRPSMPPTSLSMATEMTVGPHMTLNPLQSVGPIHPGSVLGVSVLSGVPGVPTMTIPFSGAVAVSNSYVAPPPTEAMLASYNHATAVDYMGYMGVYPGPAGPMPVTSVAAPPLPYTGPTPPTHQQVHLPHRKKEALMSELNSFYSDIASLDSNSRDAVDDDNSQDAAPVELPLAKSSTPPVTNSPATTLNSEESTKQLQQALDVSSQVFHKNPISAPENLDSSTKKKKKTKLAPGLTLKKKGVSNMVAKWQQVQQEAWKDYQDEENVE